MGVLRALWRRLHEADGVFMESELDDPWLTQCICRRAVRKMLVRVRPQGGLGLLRTKQSPPLASMGFK